MIEMRRYRPKLGCKNLDIGQIIAEKGLVAFPSVFPAKRELCLGEHFALPQGQRYHVYHAKGV